LRPFSDSCPNSRRLSDALLPFFFKNYCSIRKAHYLCIVKKKKQQIKEPKVLQKKGEKNNEKIYDDFDGSCAALRNNERSGQ